MVKQARSLIIITPICFVLAGLTILLCFIDNTFAEYKILIAALLAVWAFFIVPSVVYAIDRLKTRLKNTGAEVSSRTAFYMGYVWGDLIFICLILIAPISGILWFVKIIREIALSRKNYADVESLKTDAADVFDSEV